MCPELIYSTSAIVSVIFSSPNARMSTNSSSTQQNLLQSEEEEATVPRNLKQHSDDVSSDDANNNIVSSSTHKDQFQKDEDTCEDDEGFKTPTSSDHKIPANQQCPPAPRKPRPPTLLKRKATASSPLCSGAPHCRMKLHYYDDSSAEVDSKFCPPSAQHDDEDNAEEQERKRPRRVMDDEDD